MISLRYTLPDGTPTNDLFAKIISWQNDHKIRMDDDAYYRYPDAEGKSVAATIEVTSADVDPEEMATTLRSHGATVDILEDGRPWKKPTPRGKVSLAALAHERDTLLREVTIIRDILDAAQVPGEEPHERVRTLVGQRDIAYENHASAIDHGAALYRHLSAVSVALGLSEDAQPSTILSALRTPSSASLEKQLAAAYRREGEALIGKALAIEGKE